MASMIVLYTKPDDVAGFEAHYREAHLPLVAAVPDVTGTTVTRITGTPRGPAPYYLATEIRFGASETLSAALRTEEMMAVSKDAMALCQRYGTEATILLGEDF